MKSILDIGKRGNERASEIITPNPEVQLSDPILTQALAIVRRFPKQVFQAETSDGIRRSIEVRSLKLDNPKVFELAQTLATYEPIVYAASGGRRVMGMLSPNYDPATDSATRLPSLKIIPLQTPYPLSPTLQPDARMATMLAGAISTERKGSGSHEGSVALDLEHRVTLLGAVSLGDSVIVREHANHAQRVTGSVATGLTNGGLGNVFAPDPSQHDFSGFGVPLIIGPHSVGPHDLLFIPGSFTETEAAYGVSYADAGRIFYGAGLQNLYNRHGGDIAAVNGQIEGMASQL